jgi:lipopolysaccharide export system permease protein
MNFIWRAGANRWFASRQACPQASGGVTTLDRYIFRNVLFATLGAISICAFVLLVGNVVKDLLKAFAAGQIDLPTFAQATVLLLPYVLSMALPLGLLTGILLVLGRLSAQQEITAMRAAGWGLVRISRPILILATGCALLSLWLNCEISPRVRNGYNEIRAAAVRTNPLSFIVPHEFVRNFPGYVIHVLAKEGTEVRDLTMWHLDTRGRVKGVLRAASGSVEFDEDSGRLLITPRHGTLEVRDSENPGVFTKDPQVVQFEEWQRIPLRLDELVGRSTYRAKLANQTFAQLSAALDKAKAGEAGVEPAEQRRRVAQIRYTIQKQFSVAAGVLAFALIGVPLGIRMQRKETSANLGLAMVLALVFLFAQMIIDWSQKRPDIHPELLVWLPCVIYAVLGMWLFSRAERR